MMFSKCNRYHALGSQRRQPEMYHCSWSWIGSVLCTWFHRLRWTMYIDPISRTMLTPCLCPKRQTSHSLAVTEWCSNRYENSFAINLRIRNVIRFLRTLRGTAAEVLEGVEMLQLLTRKVNLFLVLHYGEISNVCTWSVFGFGNIWTFPWLKQCALVNLSTALCKGVTQS